MAAVGGCGLILAIHLISGISQEATMFYLDAEAGTIQQDDREGVVNNVSHR